MTPQHPASGASQGSQQIRSVQALRAIAALFVVTYHSTVLCHDEVASAPLGTWDNGNSGVDLFFVISGFIMMVSSQRLRQRTDGWLKFIRLRLVRLVPLYWLATAAKLALVTAIPAVALHTHPDAWNAVASLLFIPSVDAAGMIVPVIGVGWTLSFEMLFYAAFAAALYLLLNPLAVVAPAMIGLAALSVARQDSWPAVAAFADPIVLEFIFGLLIGQLSLAQDLRLQNLRLQDLRLAPKRLRRPVVTLIGVAGLAAMALVPTHDRWERVLIWGIAAAAALWAALAVEAWAGHAIPKLLIRIGEASYSLYLTHGFVLPVMGVIIGRARLPPLAAGMALIPACLVASTALSLLVYQYVEMPMTNRLRASFDERRVRALAAPQAPV